MLYSTVVYPSPTCQRLILGRNGNFWTWNYYHNYDPHARLSNCSLKVDLPWSKIKTLQYSTGPHKPPGGIFISNNWASDKVLQIMPLAKGTVIAWFWRFSSLEHCELNCWARNSYSTVKYLYLLLSVVQILVRLSLIEYPFVLDIMRSQLGERVLLQLGVGITGTNGVWQSNHLQLQVSKPRCCLFGVTSTVQQSLTVPYLGILYSSRVSYFDSKQASVVLLTTRGQPGSGPGPRGSFLLAGGQTVPL